MKKTLLAAAVLASLSQTVCAQSPSDLSVLKLNSEMMKLYDGALQNAQSDLLKDHPVIVALFTGQGGKMMLYRNGQPPLVAPRVPIRYELMKSVSHSSMAIFAHLLAHVGDPPEKWKGPLAEYRATSQTALASVATADLPDEYKENLRQTLRRNLAVMDKALAAGAFTEAELDAYAADLKPFLMKNVAWAAETQVGHWMGVIEDWKRMLGPDWDKTYGCSNTLYVTRQNNILFCVLAQFFGKDALNSRLFLFETSGFTTEPEHMLSLLSRIVGDRTVGQAFFGDYYLMDYELMGGDARRAIEEEDKKRGLEVNLPALVPFHSNEWPMHHDPTSGRGPATLQQVK